ncbi:hypothetical protein [Hamadaea tsunoensis]|uniref:hypothetical protein n=1 Tax=Hamadaea tsunoensis TaxID=53368 RepID=UPI0004873EFC|nr:hypothetical protein [Hamadaea tsunoensis]
MIMPDSLVVTGTGLPDVCVRHGSPALAKQDFKVFTRMPWWPFLFVPVMAVVSLFFATHWLAAAGAVPYLAVRVRRDSLDVRAWAFCRACVKTHVVRLLITMAIFLAGVAATVWIFAAVTDEEQHPELWLLGVLVLVVAGFAFYPLSTWRFIARAHVVGGGSAVKVRDPHPGYAAAAEQRLAASGYRPDGSHLPVAVA